MVALPNSRSVGTQQTPTRNVLILLTLTQKENNDHGDKTYSRTSTTPSSGLRTAPRSPTSPGTRLVLQELLRGEFRRLDANRRAWDGKWHARDDGAQLLGASLRAA